MILSLVSSWYHGETRWGQKAALRDGSISLWFTTWGILIVGVVSIVVGVARWLFW